MSNLPDTVKESRENVETFVRQQMQLIRLEMVEKAANLGSSLVMAVVFASLAASFFLLINLGLSLYLNETLDSAFAGFFIMAGFYLLVCLLLFLLRKPLLYTPVQDLVVRELMENDDPQTEQTDGAQKD